MIVSQHNISAQRTAAVVLVLCLAVGHAFLATAGVPSHTRPSDLHLYHQIIKALAPVLWSFLLLRVSIRIGVFGFFLGGFALMHYALLIEWAMLYFVVAPSVVLLADVEMLLAMFSFSMGVFLWGSERITFSTILSTDLLTGLFNRRYFVDKAEKAIAARANHNVSLMMVRINRFWAYNQYWGTAEGDKALKELARCLVVNMHQDDLCCRYGTTTFAVLMLGVSEQAVQSRVRWIEGRVAHLEMSNMGQRLGLQISVVADSLHDHELPGPFLHRVESKLAPDLHGEYLEIQGEPSLNAPPSHH
jgi:diguanylate cyclase (GGDEF)-like protein